MLLDENEQASLIRALKGRNVVSNFDVNHDGLLDASEQAKLSAYLQQWSRPRRSAQDSWQLYPAQRPVQQRQFQEPAPQSRGAQQQQIPEQAAQPDGGNENTKDEASSSGF